MITIIEVGSEMVMFAILRDREVQSDKVRKMYIQEIFLKTNKKRLFDRASVLYERRYTSGLKSQFSA